MLKTHRLSVSPWFSLCGYTVPCSSHYSYFWFSCRSEHWDNLLSSKLHCPGWILSSTQISKPQSANFRKFQFDHLMSARSSGQGANFLHSLVSVFLSHVLLLLTNFKIQSSQTPDQHKWAPLWFLCSSSSWLTFPHLLTPGVAVPPTGMLTQRLCWI